ncbi:5,16-dihydrobiliverdin:ferredoxin oxidoreductase [Acrasis kona]|uniref:5,16-dihydrobiliverdin:ferredoxin oxidoreductase n=1 Tax=Acrasis kona TaxID=1008807 RepID=A0AAW2ZNI8_9EUKA
MNVGPSAKKRRICSYFSDDVLRYIIPFIDEPITVCNIEATCRDWRSCMQSNECWMKIERETFKTSDLSNDHKYRYLERLQLLFNERKHIKLYNGEYLLVLKYSDKVLSKFYNNFFNAFRLTIRFYLGLDELQTHHPDFNLGEMKRSLLTSKQNYFFTEWAFNEGSKESAEDFVIIGYTPDGAKKSLTINYTHSFSDNKKTLIVSASDCREELKDIMDNTVDFSRERDEVCLTKLRDCLIGFSNIFKYCGTGDIHQRIFAAFMFVVDSCGLTIEDENKSNIERLLRPV